MTASDLYADLRASGLRVEVLEGWEERGGPWSMSSGPVGIMQHHTAPPVPFPPEKLIGSQLKANANTKPDGTIWLCAYRACNYSSGSGSSVVLAETRSAVPPPANASSRGLSDDTNGNPWYWNIENDHPGDGSPIPGVQLESIAELTRILCDHFGLSWQKVVGHAEWTARKIDPYWNADRRCIEEIRQMVKANTDPDDLGPNGEPNWSEVSDWARKSWTDAYQEGALTEDSHPKDVLTKEEFFVHLNRTGDLSD